MVEDILIYQIKTHLMDSEKNGAPVGKINFLNKLLGAGGHAKVYLAEDQIKQKFAVKKISKMDLSQELLEAYRNQYKILSRINSPYVVRVYHTSESDNYLQFTMQLCDTDLEQEIRINPPPFSVCEQILQKLCMSYYQVAKLGLVHRDIKPSNFLLKGNYIKLADFGTAKKIKDTTNTFVGTNIYMSPQILAGEQYSVKADIWSLGVTLYWICYQKYPWGKADKQYLNKCKQLPNLQPYPTQLLANFIYNCLQFKEENRVAPRYIFYLINKQDYIQYEPKKQVQEMELSLNKKWSQSKSPKMVKLRSTMKTPEIILDQVIKIPDYETVLESLCSCVNSNQSKHLDSERFGQLLSLYSDRQFTNNQISECFESWGVDKGENISIQVIIKKVEKRKIEIKNNIDDRTSRIFFHINLVLKKKEKTLQELFEIETEGKQTMDQATFIDMLERVEKEGKIIARLSLQQKKELFNQTKSNQSQVQFENFKKLYIKMNNIFKSDNTSNKKLSFSLE